MRWGRLWTTPESTQTLCLFRVVWAVFLFNRMSAPMGWWRYPFFRLHLYSDTRHYLMAGYHAAWFRGIPTPSFEGFCLLEDVSLILVVLLAIGLGTRLVAPAVLVLYTYRLALSQFYFHHHLWCLILGLCVLSLSVCDEHYSVDAWLRRRNNSDPPPDRIPVPRRLLQVLVAIIYVGGISGKMTSYSLNGGEIRHLVREHFVYGPFGDTLARYAPVLAWSSLVMETWVLCTIWFPRMRGLALFTGVLLHAGLEEVMPVTAFSYEMLALYMVFLNPACHRVVATGPSRWMGVGRAFDWLLRVQWIEGPEVSAQVGERRYEGVDAAIHMLMRLPLTFVLAMPAWWIRSLFKRGV